MLPVVSGVPRRRGCVGGHTGPSAATLTPAEARQRYGYDKLAEAHLALRAKQANKVFGEGGKPSDEGIIESQQILGSIA